MIFKSLGYFRDLISIYKNFLIEKDKTTLKTVLNLYI
jgi:hypothetical protein